MVNLVHMEAGTIFIQDCYYYLMRRRVQIFIIDHIVWFNTFIV